jgi:glyoxylase-like metal-dependent hydrolase (beta-lactamase superfamily II)
MKINKYSLGQLQANCYIVENENNCLIFDPGDSADFILNEINLKKLEPLALFITHGHFDHILAVGEIQLSFDIPLYVSKKDMFLLDRAKETADYYLGFKNEVIKPTEIKYFVSKRIKISTFIINVIETPGHTPGSVCFYFEKEKWLLTGDTLFKDGIGRYDFSYSSKKDIAQSINQLYMLPDDVIVYPGHGETTTIKNEKEELQIDN